MRILFLAQLFPPEGGAAANRIYEFAKRLQGEGEEVEVICEIPHYPAGVVAPEYRRKLSVKEEYEGIPVRRCWTVIAKRESRLRTLLNWLIFSWTCYWYALFRTRRPDVIVATTPTLFVALTGAIVSWLRRVPLILDVRDIWPDDPIRWGWLRPGPTVWFLRLIERICYRRAAHIAVVTDSKRDNLIAKGVPAEKVEVIANGANTEMFRPGITDLPEGHRQHFVPGAFTIIYTGYFADSQGLDVVIQAAAKLREKRLSEGKEVVHFVFVGDGRKRKEIESLAEETQVLETAFLGELPRREVPALVNAASAGLVPLVNAQLTESVPSKLFDVLACGCPVVLCAAGEAAEIVTEAEAGVVAEPGNVDSLVEAIDKLSSDPEQAVEMGKRGRHLVETRFNRALAASQLRAAARALLKS